MCSPVSVLEQELEATLACAGSTSAVAPVPALGAKESPRDGETSAEANNEPAGSPAATHPGADHPDPAALGTIQDRKPCKNRRTCKCGRHGKPGKRKFEYIRHSTLTLIAAFIVATGQAFGHIGPTRTGDDLERFMEYLASIIEGPSILSGII